jgi:hypothetical protein
VTMANNRMYLRCLACGKEHALAKHMADGWYGTSHPKWAADFHAFLVEHGNFTHHYEHEHDLKHPDPYGDEHELMFELVYESAPPWRKE